MTIMPVKPSKVTTSLVVDFGNNDGDASGILTAKVDDDPAGLNGGETSFVPGDTVGYAVAKSSNVTIDVHIATYGSPSSAGTRSFRHEETITFTGDVTTSPEYPILGGFSYQWYGRNPGTLTATETEVLLKKSTPAELPVGVAKISYDTSVSLFTIGSPNSMGGSQEFAIVVYLAGTAS